ncbi:MAG: LuxR C-terminal-related transcriptional regulator [Planctomycetes bacterium]|nr:LuxR C-terminal-related transcriptional regulator [Planctomycetota bacterium]
MPDMRYMPADGSTLLSGEGEDKPVHVVRRATAAAASSFHTAILPGCGLLMSTLITYTGFVSHNLRSTGTGRTFYMAILIPGAAVLGGALFTRVLDWAHGSASPGQALWRKSILALWLLSSLITVAPGFNLFITSEPLRCAAGVCIGLGVAPAYHLFFSRFPRAWRGRWFGISTAAGILCWSIMLQIVWAWPVGADAAYHPIQLHVYILHTAFIAVLAGITLNAFLRHYPASEPGRRETPGVRAAPASGARLLIVMAVVLYTMNGVLGVRLSPVIPGLNGMFLPIFSCMVMASGAPLAGWLTDKNPAFFFRNVVPVCCGVFLLVPSLAALGYTNRLYAVLLPIGATAQLAIFAMCTVSLAALAPSMGKAVFFTTCLYAMRGISPVVMALWNKVFEAGTGTTVFAATVMACVILALGRRVGGVLAAQSGNGPEKAVRAPSVPVSKSAPADSGEALSAFLDTVDLTPREREVAALVLQGKTTLDIAAALDISERTAKKHLSNVFRKFGVVSAMALSTRYLEALLQPTATARRPDERTADASCE